MSYDEELTTHIDPEPCVNGGNIIVHLEKENLLKFVQVVEELGLKPKSPVKLNDFIDPEKRRSWIADKAMTVFSLYDVSAQ